MDAQMRFGNRDDACDSLGGELMERVTHHSGTCGLRGIHKGLLDERQVIQGLLIAPFEF